MYEEYKCRLKGNERKNILSNRIIERQRTRFEQKITNDCCLLSLKLYFSFITFPEAQSWADVAFACFLYYRHVIIFSSRKKKTFYYVSFEMNPKKASTQTTRNEKMFFDNLLRFAEETFSFLKRKGEKITNCTRWSWIWIQICAVAYLKRTPREMTNISLKSWQIYGQHSPTQFKIINLLYQNFSTF